MTFSHLRQLYMVGVQLAALMMPFHAPFLGVLATVLVALLLVGFAWGGRPNLHNKGLLVLASLWLLYLLFMYQLVYDDGAGLSQILETRAGLWVGLLIVASLNPKYNETRRVYVMFRSGLVVSLLVCLAVGMVRALLSSNPEKLTHSELSLFMHPGYLAAMIWGAIWAEIFVFKKPWSLACSLFWIFLLLLATKAFWLAAIILAILTQQQWKGTRTSWIACRKKILFAGTALLLSSVFLLQQRLGELWAELQGRWPEKEYRSSVLVRWQVWSAGLTLLGQSGWWGLGESAVRERLNGLYQENGYTVALKNRYNTHNLFLEEALLHGMPGLLFVLAIILGLWKPLWRDYGLSSLALLAAFVSWGLTESFLQRSMGCLWIGFLWSLLTRLSEKEFLKY
ncbi:MAG: O-antigen ligase family protein [Flavobacteriales bacterium]|nr:O-antigen ligase family protein [Flavobacteriales bacterium]MCX7769163.1 O-antigen ligase family protein [Flavobacteriales bacterium]MDW8410301.1 O-antigen ligase family protein [Flavobacteriales bacterium]